MAIAADSIGQLVTRTVVMAEMEDTVRVALQRMVAEDIGSVVVTGDEKPVGIFTERDLSRAVLRDISVLERAVGEVMSSFVVTLTTDTKVVDACDMVNQRGIRRLPVVEDDRLVGIVPERDLVRWVGQVTKE